MFVNDGLTKKLLVRVGTGVLLNMTLQALSAPLPPAVPPPLGHGVVPPTVLLKTFSDPVPPMVTVPEILPQLPIA